MLKRLVGCLLLSMSLVCCGCISADSAPLSLELQNINLTDALRILAKFLHLNVVLSPSVQGITTLSLHNAGPADALDTLLMSHGLAKWPVGNVWFIAPQAEFIKRKQDEQKWRQLEMETNPLVTTVWQIKYAKADEVARLLLDKKTSLLSKRGHIRVDTRTNMLCVQDVPESIQNIRKIIDKLDVPVQQIAIEARLASVDNDFERDLGIQFAVKSDEIEYNVANKPRLAPQQMGKYSLAVAKLADAALLDVKLTALENAGHAKLISSPSLFTANQQTAYIEAGEEVPYQEVSQSGGTGVVFKKAVLGLKVTPQVLPGNKVLLQLQINQDRPNSNLVLGVPTISTRRIVTNILVGNGQTIVLGGIYESNSESGELGIPFLNRVPWLGLLFKQWQVRENKRELLIFVTPTIVT